MHQNNRKKLWYPRGLSNIKVSKIVAFVSSLVFELSQCNEKLMTWFNAWWKLKQILHMLRFRNSNDTREHEFLYEVNLSSGENIAQICL